MSVQYLTLRLLGALCVSASALHLPQTAVAPARHAVLQNTRSRIVRCADEKSEEEANAEGSMSLEQAFQERLKQEGGATQFKLRTDASRAADTVKDSFKSVADKVSDAGSGLLDAGSGRPPRDGLLDQSQWNLTVGFFAVLIVLSVGNALFNAPPTGGSPIGTGSIDTFTSDGGALQFGRQ